MEPLNGDENSPQVSSEQRAANELVKRIRKLRWMGMEGEAKRLQGTLTNAPRHDCILAEPRETD